MIIALFEVSISTRPLHRAVSRSITLISAKTGVAMNVDQIVTSINPRHLKRLKKSLPDFVEIMFD